MLPKACFSPFLDQLCDLHIMGAVIFIRSELGWKVPGPQLRERLHMKGYLFFNSVWAFERHPVF
jgi:hypothetical protein